MRSVAESKGLVVSVSKKKHLKYSDPSASLDEPRFRTLIQSVTDYAIYLLDAHGTITSWNAGAQRIIGFAPEEVLGEPFSRLFQPEERRSGAPRQALLTAQNSDRFESEGWQLHKDGTPLWANTVVEAIRDDRNELLGYACITRDATAKRAAEDALRESERQFRLLVAGEIGRASCRERV